MNKKINQNLYNKSSRNYKIKEEGVVMKTDDPNRVTKRIKFDLNLEDSDSFKPQVNSNGVPSILINYKPRLTKKNESTSPDAGQQSLSPHLSPPVRHCKNHRTIEAKMLSQLKTKRMIFKQ